MLDLYTFTFHYVYIYIVVMPILGISVIVFTFHYVYIYMQRYPGLHPPDLHLHSTMFIFICRRIEVL